MNRDRATTIFAIVFGAFLIAIINLYNYNPTILNPSLKRNQVLGIQTKNINQDIYDKSTVTNQAQTGEFPIKKQEVNAILTLNKFFDDIDETENLSNVTTILATGDVMLGRSVNYMTLKSKDFSWPYKNIDDLFNNSDLNFINLETPITENCKVRNDGMLFCANKLHAKELAKQNVNLVSLANNHTMNHGKNGLNETINLLNQNGVEHVGVNTDKTNSNIYYKNISGTKFAFLGYDDIECYSPIACIDKNKIKNDVQIAEKNADVVVIMYHWGVEYTHQPTDRQIDIAHFSIDNGADLVLGNHPHWYQPVEIYKNKVIMYSHGNFIFDQMWSEKTKEGIVGKYKFVGNNLIDVEFTPIYIENYGQPRIPNGAKGDKIISNLEEISETLN